MPSNATPAATASTACRSCPTPIPADCPDCGAARKSRQLTAPQFRLAGGGWYETDFKKDGDKKRNLAGEGGATPTTSESKPADSKPAEKKAEPAAKSESKPAESKPAPAKPASGAA